MNFENKSSVGLESTSSKNESSRPSRFVRLGQRLAGAMVAMGIGMGAAHGAEAAEPPKPAPAAERATDARIATQYGMATFVSGYTKDGFYGSRMDIVDRGDDENAKEPAYSVKFEYKSYLDTEGNMRSDTTVRSEGSADDRYMVFKKANITQAMKDKVHASGEGMIAIWGELGQLSNRYKVLVALEKMGKSNSQEYAADLAALKKAATEFQKEYPDYKMPAEYLALK